VRNLRRPAGRRRFARSVASVHIWGYVDAPLALAVLGTALVVLGGAGAVAWRRGADGGVVVARVLLAAGVGAMLVLGLTGGSDARAGVNLVPLRGIVGQAHNPDLGLLVVNLAGNVLAFAPAGALAVPALRRGLVGGAVAGTAVSVVIEVVQLGLGRVFDVDDLLLNALGSALGAAFAVRVRERRRRRRAQGGPDAGPGREHVLPARP
jgi:hypothetical protein